MSGDDSDDFALWAVEADAVSTGAAADSAQSWERLKNLPRLLRYAMLVRESADHVPNRLIAEIDELCPQLVQNAAWAASLDADAGLVLAAELDHRAVTQNEPELRGLADCVRLLCLPTPRDVTQFEDFRRVGKALVQAFRLASSNPDLQLVAELERFTFGWAALPACTDLLPTGMTAASNAVLLGRLMAERRIAATKAKIRRVQEEAERRKKEEAEKTAKVSEETASEQAASEPAAIPEHHLVVARLSEAELKNPKLKDIVAPFKAVINVALPLVKMPPLQEVRNALRFEFPYAHEVIDFALADLAGRSTVHLRPLILVGAPGSGKSRLARRLGDLLGVAVWRTDATQADGASFGGTARRWSSSEPCHPFLAIAQGKIANPLILIDELEKCPSRTDSGRLWDALLGCLEPETNARYPDPALQTTLDLSHVSYIATANSVEPLPTPIRDRFRVVRLPTPGVHHLDALLPAVLADLARERGLDQRWVRPLDGIERALVARYWRGGSVRRLRAIVEAIWREQELRASRN